MSTSHDTASASPAARAGGAPRALFLASAALVSLFAWSCTRTAAQPAEPPPPQVTVAAAVGRDLTEWDEFTGRLEAVNTVDIRPRVSGFVSSVKFQEGAIVNRGDLLFLIDPRPFQAEVDRLAAELDRVRATVKRATSELARADRLATENAISGEEHDRRAAFAQESTAEVSAVTAALRAAELNLEFTRVTAPITGRIGRAIVTEGNLVSSGPGEATLLTTLVSLDPIYAAFDADEQAFLRYMDDGRRAGKGRGAPIGLALAGEEGYPRSGELTFLDNRVDPTTGTIRGRALFRNGDLSLTPGLFVRVRIPASRNKPGVLIQDRAVGTDLDRRFVLVVDAEQSVAARPVTLGPVVDGLRVVREGIKAGDLVVVNGIQHARPGAKVTPVVVAMEPAKGERQ